MLRRPPRSTRTATLLPYPTLFRSVTTLLQGSHWVSAYQEQFNIRVMNLSWGTASTQDPAVDPLNYAVQRLWKQGITVVVAAGNSGPNAGTIMKPADDPMVLTVGGFNDNGTASLSADETVSWRSEERRAGKEWVRTGRT